MKTTILPGLFWIAVVSVCHSQNYITNAPWIYTLDVSNQATLTQYIGADNELQIPATIGGFPVMALGNGATAVISNDVSSVTIPSSVTSISANAFKGSGLNSITVPSSVTNIGGNAFEDCFDLYAATIDSIGSLGSYAFLNCSRLESVNIGNGVTSIANYAFQNCVNLVSVSIGSGVTNIGHYAFGLELFGSASCRSLRFINVSAANSFYSSISQVLFDKSGANLIMFPAGRSDNYNIPMGVTNIGDSAFANCDYLTSVNIPDSVLRIGVGAFSSCSRLQSLTIGAGVTNIEAYAFSSRGIDLTSLFFLGSAPTAAANIFYTYSPLSSGVVYYVSGKTGWTNTFCGLPTASLPIAPLVNSLSTSRFEYGVQAVLDYPAGYNLYSQSQYDDNRAAGRADVVGNPASYNLYTSDSIMDLRMGGLMIQKQGTNAVVSFQPQTTTDLTQPFTNNGIPITSTIAMPGNKGFIRINAKP